MFRPEDVILRAVNSSPGENSFPGVVEQAIFLGGRVQCQVIVNSIKVRGEAGKSETFEAGQQVTVEIPRPAIHVLLESLWRVFIAVTLPNFALAKLIIIVRARRKMLGLLT